MKIPWCEDWDQKRNAAVAALVANREHRNQDSATQDREVWDDEQMKWLFFRQYRTDKSRSDRDASPDAYLYEGVTACMAAARRDERERIARAISTGLKALLGDEFISMMYDMANVNDVNIGRD